MNIYHAADIQRNVLCFSLEQMTIFTLYSTLHYTTLHHSLKGAFMDSTGQQPITCPYCKKTNSAGTVKCSCGYFFDKSAYVEKEQSDNAKAAAVNESGGFFASEKKMMNSGALPGIAMMVGAVIWFFAAYFYADRIFFYPPILFVVGLISLVKSLGKSS